MVEIKDQIEKILIKNLKYSNKYSSLDWDSDLKSLGLDSMSLINIIMAIEDELGISIPDEYLNFFTFKSANTLFKVVALFKN